MLRLTRLLQTYGGQAATTAGASRPPTSEFARRASLLKRRFRGKGQYEFARNEAQRFLDAEVPKAHVNAWMENSANAISLSQVLRFFEVTPDATLSALLLNTLVRTAEDARVDARSRLEAVLSLTSLRPEENYERAFGTVEDVLKGVARQPQASGKEATQELWTVLELSAKVLQRCGKRVPTALSERLTTAVMGVLRTTDPTDFPGLQSSLLRIYSWMVRAEREEARHLLFVLVTHTGDFIGYNYATLMLSCGRHHQLHALPVDLIQKLARTGLQYCTSANGRDAAAIVSTIARMLGTLEVGKNGVQARDRSELQNRFNALLEDYRPRVLRFMDETDKLYWSHSEDVTSLVFAYELGGHLRYRAVFEAYAVYVAREVPRFEPTQLAMATGILRRAHLLTPQLATKLSERIELVLGELRLAELSHICATFAALPQRPAWMHEAKAVALRLPTAEASGLTLLNLALAFPDDDSFVSRVPYETLSARQLVDTLPLVLGSSQFELPVVAALLTRLADPTERVSPDDVRVLLTSNRPQLATAVGSYLSRRFAEPEWDADTLYYLPLVVPSGQFGATARDPVKAVAAAQAAAISPEQFVSLVELLLGVFGDADASIANFVRTGGEDLLTAEKVLGRTAVRYLAAVRGLASLQPSEHWLSLFAEKLGLHLHTLKPEELESLLVSLHTTYGDVARTPALQTVLSEIAEDCYPRFTTADAQTARLTVLLVYLQRGMSFPLLTEETGMVKQVRAAVGALPQDVQEAVANMPVPAAATPKAQGRVGRFTLKQVPPSHSKAAPVLDADDTPVVGARDDMDMTFGGDPFDSPLAAAPARSAQAPPAATTSATAATDEAPSRTAESAAKQAEAPPHRKERQTSYYTKFFNSSVGQLFMGKGVEDEDDTPTTRAKAFQDPQPQSYQPPQAQQPQAPPPEAPLRPRRTTLAPSAPTHPSPTAATAAPTPAVEDPQPLQQQQQQQQQQFQAQAPPTSPPPVEAPRPGGFFANWGAPPTFPGTTPPPPPPPPPASAIPNSWSTPEAAPAAATPYDIPTSTQNSALYSSLFGNSHSSPSNPSPTQQPPPTPRSQQQQQQPPSPAASPTASAFSSIFNASSTNAGLQAPPGTADPSARAPLIRPARPVMTRKGVITRPGAATANTTASTPVSANNQAATAANATSTSAYETFLKNYADPSTRAASKAQPSNHAPEPQIVLKAPGASQDGGAGVADFMNKAGLAKITGYNMDGSEGGNAEEPVAAASAQATVVGTAAPVRDRPLAWQEAARQVGRVSRYGKTKTRTRSQQSLSEWLNEPAKKLIDSVGAGAANPTAADEAAAVTSPPAAAGKGRGRGRKNNGKAATTADEGDDDSAAAASTTHATATHGRGKGKGKHAGAAGAAAHTAAASGGKRNSKAAAAGGKKGAAKPKPKPAAAAAGAKGKKPKAAPKPAAKPAKSATKPKAKKAPAPKKAAAAKKPAAKKATKGKKK